MRALGLLLLFPATAIGLSAQEPRPPVALEIRADSAPLEPAAEEYRATGGRHDYRGMWTTALANDALARANLWGEQRERRRSECPPGRAR